MRRELETGRTLDVRCWPGPFQAMVEGDKTFEFRKDDRPGGYQVGDVLCLYEWDPERGNPTERCLLKAVSYVLRGPDFGVPVGYCVLALADLEGEVQCGCTNCPKMVPRVWPSGMCVPCATAACDCEGDSDGR